MGGVLSSAGGTDRARFRIKLPPLLKPESAIRVLSKMAEAGKPRLSFELSSSDMIETSVGVRSKLVVELLVGCRSSVLVLFCDKLEGFRELDSFFVDI